MTSVALASICSKPTLTTIGRSPRGGSRTLPRTARMANNAAAPSIKRSAAIHSGVEWPSASSITVQLAPQQTIAQASSRTSRARSGAGVPIAKNAFPKIVAASPTGLTVAAMQTARESWRSFGRITLRRGGSLSIDKTCARWRSDCGTERKAALPFAIGLGRSFGQRPRQRRFTFLRNSTLEAPVGGSRQFIAIGLNYRKHAANRAWRSQRTRWSSTRR